LKNGFTLHLMLIEWRAIFLFHGTWLIVWLVFGRAPPWLCVYRARADCEGYSGAVFYIAFLIQVAGATGLFE